MGTISAVPSQQLTTWRRGRWGRSFLTKSSRMPMFQLPPPGRRAGACESECWEPRMVPTRTPCPKCGRAALVGEKTDRGHVETCPHCGFDRGCVLVPVEQLRYLQEVLHEAHDREPHRGCAVCEAGSNFDSLPHSFDCCIETALTFVEARLGEAYESTPTIQRLIPRRAASDQAPENS